MFVLCVWMFAASIYISNLYINDPPSLSKKKPTKNTKQTTHHITQPTFLSIDQQPNQPTNKKNKKTKKQKQKHQPTKKADLHKSLLGELDKGDAYDFKFDGGFNTQEFQGVDYRDPKARQAAIDAQLMELMSANDDQAQFDRRARKPVANYNEDAYYRQVRLCVSYYTLYICIYIY
jgi:hypothetical protein